MAASVSVPRAAQPRPQSLGPASLDQGLAGACHGLLGLQQDDGHWIFELEADCTIPAEYILLMHFMDERDEALTERIAGYLRNRQGDDGGWPLYAGGAMDLSCSVKAYYALKLAGDHPDAPHMHRARTAILARGGAARSNVFTRIMLAQFGQVPWRAIPFMPVEIMLLPRWFPFHLSKVSYWSRTVMVPLFVLYSLEVRAANPTGTGVRELFTEDPERERDYFPVRSALNRLLLAVERSARPFYPLVPRSLKRRALERAEAWFTERLNGIDGLGAIFPAMVNAYEALAALGYPADHPLRRTARKAIDALLAERDGELYCQPCVSPVWDTGLACLALDAAGTGPEPVRAGLDWLAERQLSDEPGDWRDNRPELAGGGWPFQYRNDYYPDLDDTALVGWAMHQADPERYRENILRAARWLAGMQSSDGGFGAFDVDNTYYYLNHIPFADHGALLDPPTADVTARCVTLFARLVDDHPEFRAPLERAVAWLRREQEADGSWFGRWGTNHIYGTWSVLVGLGAAGLGRDDPAVVRAVAWLKARQRDDGGWGETNDSYEDAALAGRHRCSTAYQTAWAMLGLMAADEGPGPALDSGAAWLLERQGEDGLWRDADFTAPGFPRVFYLKYHGYDKFFPVWALGAYRALCQGR